MQFDKKNIHKILHGTPWFGREKGGKIVAGYELRVAGYVSLLSIDY